MHTHGGTARILAPARTIRRLSATQGFPPSPDHRFGYVGWRHHTALKKPCQEDNIALGPALKRPIQALIMDPLFLWGALPCRGRGSGGRPGPTRAPIRRPRGHQTIQAHRLGPPPLYGSQARSCAVSAQSTSHPASLGRTETPYSRRAASGLTYPSTTSWRTASIGRSLGSPNPPPPPE